jgi:hypothetical protein
VKTPKGTPSETVHAPWWPEGEDAEVKTFLSGWDTLLLGDSLEQVRTEATEEGHSARAITYLSALTYLTQTVVRTTRRHRDGSLVRVSVDDFKQLSMEDVNFLVDEAGTRVGLWNRASNNGAATEEERRRERFPASEALPDGAGREAQSA